VSRPIFFGAGCRIRIQLAAGLASRLRRETKTSRNFHAERSVLSAVIPVKTGIQKLESWFRQVGHLTAPEIRGCQTPARATLCRRGSGGFWPTTRYAPAGNDVLKNRLTNRRLPVYWKRNGR